MKSFLCALAISLAFLPQQTRAELSIVTDIPPVQSLVLQVAGDSAASDVLLSDVVSVHDFALKPSQARQLQDADLVIWVGPILTPQLEGALASLSHGADILTLQDVEGVIHREARQEALFLEGEEHEGHDHHDGHVHSGDDPHLWLDPENAKVWVSAIAETLSDLDPARAETFSANAKRTIERLDSLLAETRKLTANSSPAFVVSHDSLLHFEARFGISAAGALAASDAVAPGPRRVAAIRETLTEQGISCLLVDVNDSPRLMASLSAPDRRWLEVDPVGTTLPIGPELYDSLIMRLAQTVSQCGQSE